MLKQLSMQNVQDRVRLDLLIFLTIWKAFYADAFLVQKSQRFLSIDGRGQSTNDSREELKGELLAFGGSRGAI